MKKGICVFVGFFFVLVQKCTVKENMAVCVSIGWQTMKIPDCCRYCVYLSLLGYQYASDLSLYDINYFHSSQNPTLETATAIYKSSKMSPPSNCHYWLRQVGEVGCCSWLQEWRTTFSLSSKTGKYRCVANKLWRRVKYFETCKIM